MMTCPGCHRDTLSSKETYKQNVGDILLCVSCGYWVKPDIFDGGMVCGGCGEEVDECDSLCPECAEKERIWFSPHCLHSVRQRSLFDT